MQYMQMCPRINVSYRFFPRNAIYGLEPAVFVNMSAYLLFLCVPKSSNSNCLYKN